MISIVKKVLFFKLIILLFVTFLFFLLLFSLDNTPFKIYNKDINFGLKTFIPQGWGFFTRNPQEEQTIFYEIQETDKQLKEIDFGMTTNENYYGLSRKIRKKYYEYSQMILKIPEKEFDSVQGKRMSLDITRETPFRLEIDHNEYPFVKEGELLVYKYQIIPWEWSRDTQIEKGRKAYVSIHFK